MSVPFNSNTESVSSAVVPTTSSTVGASFTGLTVTLTVASEFKEPSLARNVKLSEPW